MPRLNVLIIAGAGTSIELGVPGMVGLAEEFIEHSNQWHVEPELVGRILSASLDIEHLIEELDHICTARSSLEALGHEELEFDRYDNVRAEIEWFIQHAAERILPRQAHLMWGSVLRSAGDVQLTIATTNYDRAIELAANAEKIEIDDGFGDFAQRETSVWQGFDWDHPRVTLIKLHGSTDWYSDDVTGNPTKLRHPMPLFGRAALHLPDGNRLGSALILPSREKLLTRQPYPRLSQAFLNACDACDTAVIVGSSLRDHHLRGAASAIAQRVPLFVVNPDGDGYGIANATGIAATASSFLIGALADALSSSSPALRLNLMAEAATPRLGNSLRALEIALDSEQPSSLRCRALEELDTQGAALDATWLGELLSCMDPHVARYALGLIPHVGDCWQVFRMAGDAVHAANDAAYQEDLRLLESMMPPAALNG